MKKLFGVLIVVLPIFSHAGEIFLQCKVRGKHNEKRMQPASVLVTIVKQPNYLYVDVEGPSEYEVAVATTSSETENEIALGRDDSTENTFAVYNENIKKDGSRKTIYDVKINRVTGLLSVDVFFVYRHRESHISYSGACVVSSNKKKF